VFDGSAKEVNRDVLTSIYGDEDWTTITQRMHANEVPNSHFKSSDFASTAV
jgi:hypothetical protein